MAHSISRKLDEAEAACAAAEEMINGAREDNSHAVERESRAGTASTKSSALARLKTRRMQVRDQAGTSDSGMSSRATATSTPPRELRRGTPTMDSSRANSATDPGPHATSGGGISERLDYMELSASTGGAGVEGPDDGPLEQCPKCGRSFAPQSLKKHEKVCDKVFSSRRKRFDTSKRRVPGEAIQARRTEEHVTRQKERTPGRSQGNLKSAHASTSTREEQPVQPANSKPKWKQRSEAFRQVLRQMRETNAQESKSKGRPSSSTSRERGKVKAPTPPPAHSPTMEDPDRRECPHCGRKFNEQAFERHVEHCKNARARPTTLKKGAGGGGGQRGNTSSRPSPSIRR